MTEDLRTLLRERADLPDFAPVDVSAVTSSGARTVRRRRVATLGAGVAVALLVGGLGAVALQAGDGEQGFAVRQLDTDQVTWAIGSRLHTPGDSVDLRHEIATYVRTDAGFVFTDPGGSVYSYAAGHVEEVGESDDGRLAGDPHSDWAGWVDSSSGAPQVVLLDVATGQLLRPDGATELYAVGAGGIAIWRDDQGVLGHALGPGEVPPYSASDVAPGSDVLAAYHDSYAVRSGITLVVGPFPSGSWDDVPGERGAFSPAGRFLMVSDFLSGSFTVLDLDLEERVELGLPGDVAAEAVEWVGDQRLVVLVRERATLEFRLVTCDVVSAACGPVGVALDPGFRLPTGDHVDWG
jgi:hypothetical protein